MSTEIAPVQSFEPTFNGTLSMNLMDILLYREEDTVQEELKGYRGFLDVDTMEMFFDDQDIFSILKCLWTEKNPNTRLTWLRNHIHLRHPLLYFELAIEELQANPSFDTFSQVSMFYMHLGLFRLEQDLACFEEVHGEFKEKIFDAYLTKLDQIARLYIQTPYVHYLTSSEGLIQLDEKKQARKFLAAFQSSLIEEIKKIEKLDASLPKPTWVERLDEKAGFVAFPDCYWVDRRKQVATDFLLVYEGL